MIKTCVNCGYSEWQKTASGKRKLESSAKCNYPEVPLPHCFGDYRGDMPRRNSVNKYTKPGCPGWVKI